MLTDYGNVHTNTCACVCGLSEGVLGQFALQRQTEGDAIGITLGPFGRRVALWKMDGLVVVCQAAQLNRNNDLHVSSF